MNKSAIQAVATFNDASIKGYVLFTENEKDKCTDIHAYLHGLPPNCEIGWHIHVTGDLRKKGYMSCGAHYNPKNKTHGGPHSSIRHIGDLGNLITDKNGNSNSTLKLKSIKLKGKYSIIGRSLICHGGKDDFGKGGVPESKTTGNSGSRIGSAVIGYSEDSKLYF